ncbi:hypothetical protein ACFRQM_09410 [Streptomyces sp. NPDC056831]|uniref:hypothetical protein n=1 Tax=Streptomyces sp. NPDC056831 TaxID=3345954 RepID=UPI0036B66900
MNQTAAQTATVALAQVGAGRTVHFAADTANTLCGRPVSRVLNEDEAAKKRKRCTRCTVALEEATAEDVSAAEAEEAAAVEEVQVEEVPAEEAPAAVGETPAAEEGRVEDQEAPAAGEVEDAPACDVEEAPAAGQVEVTAYTAAVEQLYLNGRDGEDRALYVDADAVLDVIPTLRRMPRWNAIEQRFTVNKVALILVRDAQGERVWVRGEADPIRVDAIGTPVNADAPAEPGPVGAAAILAATRLLRRRREVQRVINNREAARAWSTPAPAVKEPAPSPEEAAAPATERPEAPAAAPEWRTLKGLETPFLLYGQEGDGRFCPANDRKQCIGEPLVITRTWVNGGIRYAEDADGRETRLWGVATKYWTAPAA